MTQDAVEANGLHLMATFFMGEASETPVQTQKQRNKVLDNFAKQVAQYSKHPALLFWSFGNELNGVWNGFLQQVPALAKPTEFLEAAVLMPCMCPNAGFALLQLSLAEDMGKGIKGNLCGWDERYDDLGGCWIHKGGIPEPGSACYNSSQCVYTRLYSLINEASRRAKEVHLSSSEELQVLASFATASHTRPSLHDPRRLMCSSFPHLLTLMASTIR